MLSVLFVQRVMCALFNSRWLFSASLEFAVIFLFTCMWVWRFDYVRCFPTIFVSIKRTAQPKRKICKVSAAAYSLFQTDFEIRRPNERRRRREKTGTMWCYYGMHSSDGHSCACACSSVCPFASKQNSPTKMDFWSRSLIFQFINNTTKSHLCVPFISCPVSFTCFAVPVSAHTR